MKTHHLLFAISFSAIILLIILTSTSFLTSGKSHSIAHDEITLILFSDTNQLSNERNYYRAIQYSQEKEGFSFQEFIFKDSTDTRSISYYNIENFPSLLIYKGEKELLRISGKQDLEQLVFAITDAVTK
ncbi:MULTISPECIES: hypothetical protein [Shouchella]|uniref:Small peptidoglycan-associated lipoprotein n=2 Tax=Shouchella TaxID=2893057 RepID=A0ABY7W4N1_9BACI|nr:MULTISPECIES: hypothetical protein [Shouchella]MED4127439.1 hypothetical protein [Shouchella miscanthi]WDF03907.1 hypothetical protein PQ477_00005 [Shouchella hunanensis]GAF24453.1 small peptidoglycan-associated lipoprotein [Bacillus sp. JCM 19047]